MLRGHALPIEYHRVLLDDFTRVDHYDRAIRALVRPGDVVLDVGTGSGLLALLAARRGARVHAVESMPVARLARVLAARNGLSDRIIVHERDLVELDPVEPVDLILGEFIGRFLVDDRMLDAVEAGGRWLKPGGRCCPSRVVLRLAPVGGFQVPQRDLWSRRLLGLDLSAAVRWAEDATSSVDLSPGALLADPADWHTWEPPGLPAPFAGEVTFRIGRGASLSGIAGWFEADLAPQIRLGAGPGATTHWGQVLFHTPELILEPGDVLRVHLEMLAGDDLDFAWRVRQIRGSAVVTDVTRRTGVPAEIEMPDPLPSAGQPQELLDLARFSLSRGDLAGARDALESATTALTPADDALALGVWEQLAVVYRRDGRPRDAVRAALRALDGDLGSRERALRHLVEAGADLGFSMLFDRWASAYEEAFGPHPARHRPGDLTVAARGPLTQVPAPPRRTETSDVDITISGETAVTPVVDDSMWLIGLAGRSVGRMFPVRPGEVILGRSPSNGIVLDDEGVSREHARLIVSADRTYRLMDLDSLNGTFVEDTRIGSLATPVREGDRIRLGPGTILKLGIADELERQVLAHLYQAATRDGLTGLLNKRFLLEQLDHEVAWHRRHGAPLSLILLDVDEFKRVNTVHGHPAGDQALTELARRLSACCREEDVLARFGGEEFVVVLRQTSAQAAVVFAERLRTAVGDTPVELASGPLPLTISLGVASTAGEPLRGDSLLEAADEAMRRAKAQGRNRVCQA